MSFVFSSDCKTLTHCSWLRQSDRCSRSLRRSATCCGCTCRCCTETPVHCRGLVSVSGHSAHSTHLSHLRSLRLHRKPTAAEHTPCCCTEKSQLYRWAWGKRPRRCRLNNQRPHRRRTRWRCTGRLRSGTRLPCSSSGLRRDMTWGLSTGVNGTISRTNLMKPCWLLSSGGFKFKRKWLNNQYFYSC